MYTYTMTFVSRDLIGLPVGEQPGDKIICGIVTEKLSKHELELADFNWSGNYSFDNSMSYLGDPYRLNIVVEVRIKLDVTAIHDRNAIYERCVTALMLDQVLLTKVKRIKNQEAGTKCILRFDMKSAA